ncbi:MAG: L-threonylcarbamoyladenylate synthase [Bryobacterales bacterium]|nr:L-threonylcarbamoyladenylate synthase [Bryobacterales bacterium]
MRACARLPVNASCPRLDALRLASAQIRRGQLVAARTDTLYGLLADACNPAALRRVFQAKGRPESKPILVLVDGMAQLARLVRRCPPELAVLARAFWPGPLTVVLPASERASSLATAGTGTIAVRQPGSPLVRSLARHAGCALTGTSANLSGRPGARSAHEVVSQLRYRVPLVLDSGRACRAEPSTIVDLTAELPRLLRRGRVGREAIERALGFRIEQP